MVKLRDMVKDYITGYEGIAVARAEYLYGCVSVQVQATGLKEDGGKREPEWIDEQRLTNDSKATAGGPQAHPPAMHP